MLQSSGVAVIHHPSAPSRDEVSAIAANLPEYAPANLESCDGDIGFVGVRRSASLRWRKRCDPPRKSSRKGGEATSTIATCMA